jgi:hypothetical protein
MATPFFSENLVKLPRLTVSELLSLMHHIEAEAEPALAHWREAGKALPDFLGKALSRLLLARRELETVQPPPSRHGAEEQLVAHQGDRTMDEAWRAFETFLKAWCRLDDGQSPGQAEAQRLYDLIIGDGMNFISLPFELEWLETRKRLDIIDRHGLTPTIEALGGARFLRHLRRAFEVYGIALQITSPQPSDASQLRSLWESAHHSVRHYFAKVVALEDPDDAEAQALVRKLLRPIVELQQAVATTKTLQLSAVGKDLLPLPEKRSPNEEPKP